jgi:hypothetical protein
MNKYQNSNDGHVGEENARKLNNIETYPSNNTSSIVTIDTDKILQNVDEEIGFKYEVDCTHSIDNTQRDNENQEHIEKCEQNKST